MDLTDRDRALIRRALTERAGALHDKAATTRDELTANSLRASAFRCDELSQEVPWMWGAGSPKPQDRAIHPNDEQGHKS